MKIFNYFLSFFSRPVPTITNDRLFSRKWAGQLVPSGPTTFKVSSYNILCQPYIGPFHFPNCPKIYKSQDYRHLLLLEELDSLQADVFSLQEVTPEYFSQLLLPEMEKRGYQGLYRKRAKEEKDGLAIFFQNRKFTLLEECHVDLNKMTAEICQEKGVDAKDFKVLQDTVALFAHLELKEDQGDQKEGGEKEGGEKEGGRQNKKSVIIGNVHIHYDWHRNDLQSLQISLTLQALDAFSQSQGSPPYLLCGDFNINPSTPAYSLLSQGIWEKELWMKGSCVPGFHGDQQAYLGDLLKDSYRRPRDDWKSAYATVLGTEPSFTNLPSHFSGCLDYIWYSGERMRPTAVLGMVEQHLLMALGGCPNQRCPSDHLALLAQFELLDGK